MLPLVDVVCRELNSGVTTVKRIFTVFYALCNLKKSGFFFLINLSSVDVWFFSPISNESKMNAYICCGEWDEYLSNVP